LRGSGSFGAILDYGCGDGFTGREVQTAFASPLLVGVDTELPLSACGVRSVAEGSHELAREEAQLGDRRFDLLLLCDVIEHVANDRELMRGIAERRLRPGALALVTVPAFQALFSDHDRALRHYRRYSLPELKATINDAGFELLDSGYLFFSLLLPRLLSKAAETLRKKPAAEEHGIGSWRGGPGTTRWLANALAVENALLLGAHRVGLQLPGLSIWALCKTR
jgi:SAM-dependent methyltransferase